eukprot:5239883-Amphidinium_carterae.2
MSKTCLAPYGDASYTHCFVGTVFYTTGQQKEDLCEGRGLYQVKDMLRCGLTVCNFPELHVQPSYMKRMMSVFI